MRRAAFTLGSLYSQQTAADQLDQNMTAGLAAQTADALARERLLVGHDGQDVDGGLRQTRLVNASVKFISQSGMCFFQRKTITIALADNVVWAVIGGITPVEFFDQ